MRVREIHTVGLRGGTPAGGWSNELRADDDLHTLMVVVTDDGLVGFGSVFTSQALVDAALDQLRPLVLEEDAREPQRISEMLDRSTFWMGRGGALTHAMSGIDIALWDILGQVAGEPIGRLLGGTYRSRVRPYASLLMQEPERLRDHLASLLSAGFRAFKIGWGPFGRISAAMDESIVATARDEVGPEAGLMVDAGASDGQWSHGLRWAIRTADMLHAYGVDWFEEPLAPDMVDSYRELRRVTRIDVAGGEVLTRRQEFRSWLDAGAVDIIQPDVTKCGGLTVMRDVASIARDRGIRLIPHGWNTAIGLAADLQIAAAFASTDRVEYIAGSPYVDELPSTPWVLDDGMLVIPGDPGLGFTPDLDALDRYAAAPLAPELRRHLVRRTVGP